MAACCAGPHFCAVCTHVCTHVYFAYLYICREKWISILCRTCMLICVCTCSHFSSTQIYTYTYIYCVCLCLCLYLFDRVHTPIDLRGHIHTCAHLTTCIYSNVCVNINTYTHIQRTCQETGCRQRRKGGRGGAVGKV